MSPDPPKHYPDPVRVAQGTRHGAKGARRSPWRFGIPGIWVNNRNRFKVARARDKLERIWSEPTCPSK